jgi:hypothetical protein
MKADEGVVVSKKDHREREFDGIQDGLVMVLFPQVAWDAVQDLAKRTNTSSAEVISIALKLLEEKLKEEARKMNGTGSG